MIRAWFARHRQVVMAATSGTLIAAVITTVAVVSSGLTTQRVDLGDAGVWVVNESRQALGRANTEIFELNSAVRSASNSLDVVQEGDTVFAVDHGSGAIERLDPATLTATDSVPLPAGDVSVWLAGDRITIALGGDLWFVDADEIDDFDAESDPTLSLDANATVTVGTTGDVFVFSPSAGEVYTIPLESSEVTTTQGVAGFGDSAAGAPSESDGESGASETGTITSVGDQWVVLANNRLITSAGADAVLDTPSTGAVLQAPGAASDAVVIATDTGLSSVSLGDGARKNLAETSSANPAPPVVLGECVFGAWGSGDVARVCDGANPVVSSVDIPAGTSRLAFVQNGARVVLNDATSGRSWATQSNNQVIDNWDDLIDLTENEQQVEENDPETPPEFDEEQQPPVAVADEFGARPGRTSTLPVLLNDYDANGDVLVISETTSLPDTVGRLSLISNDQQIQLTLADTASGRFTFDYTITDGRGGTATATVAVTVRAPGENSAPSQVRTTQAAVAQGQRLTLPVLGDWFDPDGDPFYLAAASVDAPDSVQFTPDGQVVYSDAGQGIAVKDVALSVTDGTAAGTGSLRVSVRPVNEVPIVAEGFPVTTFTGQETVISPLPHVRGGSGPIRLVNVQTPAGAQIVADYDGGTVRFTSQTAGTFVLEYSVTDGVVTATAAVRVVVKNAAPAGAPPVTVPHTSFIEQLSYGTVDVLAGDFDPAGGVLVVTGTENVPADSGVRVEIVEQRMLRVTLTKPLDAPVTFGYRVSNGVADAAGSVTVVEIPPPAERQPPVAAPDRVSVRTGDAIDIPVLANDTHPNGDLLTLAPRLTTELPANSGLLFASGSVLRYLAPDQPGNYTAVYRALAPDGQWADAEVTINVREIDAASNVAPVPRTVISRVLSGETVRITIPLSGIDPDGDSVKLIGQASNPEKGQVTASGPDFLDYQAGAYQAGTDTFTYTVIDALGAQAIGTVRVGISAKLDGSRNPVAVDDEVTVRPGKTVSVQVLQNDSDPDGGVLTIDSIEPTGEGTTARVDGEVVRITVPDREGRYGFIYTISNKWGGSSSNFVTVIARNDAPLSRPIATDVVLTLDDISDKTSIDVNVLAGVFFADGRVSSLRLSIPSSFGDSAVVTENKRVRVTISDTSQIIPFEVAHPDDPSVSALAFVWVPGSNDALPQLRMNAKKITVVSEETVTITLDDYVVAAGGREVRLTDAAKVRATNSNGAELVVDPQRLRFTSADRYFGPASVSFEVTDGSSPTDPAGRIATLVLPIEVTPRENQPPVVQGGSLDFEPGQEKSIDLTKVTSYPYVDDLDELSFAVQEPRPQGFRVRIDGQTLVVQAAENLRKGANSRVLIGVRDAVNAGTTGSIALLSVPSTRPLASPAADSAVVKRGASTTIDVLANDGATNPFPTVPLRVVGVRGLDQGIPAGISITPSNNNSSLSVSVSPSAQPQDATLQYQVADATDDPDRYAWGSIRISVQDRPDPVGSVRVASVSDRALTVTWAAGGSNNSPITGYEVSVLRGGQVLSTTPCGSTTCRVPSPGNGPENAVTVQVTAINAIGRSDPASTPDTVWSDVVPSAPTAVQATPLDGGLRITWARPSDGGGASPVTNYDIVINGDVVGSVGASSTQYAVRGLSNDTSYRYTVQSRNRFYGSTPVWQRAPEASETPAGAPIAVGAPSVSPDTSNGSTVTMSWTPSLFADNGRAVSQYFVAASTGRSFPACEVTGVEEGKPVLGDRPTSAGSSTSHTFTDLERNTNYQFVVYAYNGQGCTRSDPQTAVPRKKPGAPTATYGVTTNGTGTWGLALTGVEWEKGGGLASFEYTVTANGTPGPPRSLSSPEGRLADQFYGSQSSVTLEVCETYPDDQKICSGSPQTVTNAGVPVKITPTVERRADEGATTGTLVWSGAPAGAGYTAVTYSCDGTTFAAMPTAGECAITRADASATWPGLTVRVSANGTSYERVFTP